MKKTISLIAALYVAIVFITSCEEEIVTPVCDGSTPTYNSDIKTIIDNNCTSCHDSGSKNFKTYQGLKPYLDNGKFKLLVLEKQTMPKGNKSLSQEELNKIQCWVNNGYPEK